MVNGPAYSGAVFGYAVANGRFLVDRRTSYLEFWCLSSVFIGLEGLVYLSIY